MRSTFLAVTMLLGLASWAGADTVAVSNGDWLSGTVLTMTDGRLALETEYAGVIEIEWAKVEQVWLEEALPMVLADGTESLVQELPSKTVALADVAALAPPAPPPPPPVKWQGRVDLGWARAEGNRNTELGALTAFAQREDPARSRLAFLLDAAQGSSEGEETANRARAEAKLDRSSGDSTYRYFLAGAGYDRVRDIDLRLELGSGMGRTLIERPGHLLTAEAGVSWVRDAFTVGGTESDAKLRIGETWRRQLGASTSLTQTLAMLSAADELGDYTAEFVLALTHKLTDRMSLTSKLVDTYDSRPALGTERNDLMLATQVGVAFAD